MTAQTRGINKAAFEQGDKPQGSDFVNLIDSYVGIADTSAQTMQSTLTVPGLTCTGPLVVSALTVQTMIVSSLAVLTPISLTGPVSAATMICESLTIGGTANTSVLHVSSTVQAYWVNVSNRINWGSVAGCQLGVNGTVNAVGFRFLDAPITNYTSAQTSAFFHGTEDGGMGGALGAIKFVRITVNGSVYAIPLFKGSLVP